VPVSTRCWCMHLPVDRWQCGCGCGQAFPFRCCSASWEQTAGQRVKWGRRTGRFRRTHVRRPGPGPAANGRQPLPPATNHRRPGPVAVYGPCALSDCPTSFTEARRALRWWRQCPRARARLQEVDDRPAPTDYCDRLGKRLRRATAPEGRNWEKA
jgi:hypothetical protein